MGVFAKVFGIIKFNKEKLSCISKDIHIYLYVQDIKIQFLVEEGGGIKHSNEEFETYFRVSSMFAFCNHSTAITFAFCPNRCLSKKRRKRRFN
jgi:hypothetical protein